MAVDASFLASDLRRDASAAKRFQAEKHKAFAKAERARWDDNIPNQTWPFWPHQRAAIRSFKLDRPEAVLEERRVRRTYNQLMFTDRYDDPLDRGCPVAGKSAAARNGSSESLAGSSDADVDAEADADITYTFDHATGPTGGDQILGDALAKAVERFETTQTERLVNKEYEVLDSEGEAVRRVQRGSGGGSGANAARRRQRRARRREDVLSDAGNEDGYEFV